ncbi:MAG: ATP-binding cassette domain-containing protein, partial [Vibrio sp.]
LMPIAGAFQHLGQTLTSARRLNEIILAKPEVEFTQKPTTHNGQYGIEFNGVNFAYQANKPNTIDEFTLSLPQGHKVAIVGQTGSGKSTLIQLLCRYWDMQAGQITIGGTDIREWRESDLRAAISVVSQRVDILNGTLRDNLKLANAEASDEQLSEILRQVGLEKLLQDSALNAWLGDGGRQLSGGEKRRIGIARALLHDAPILLLDEPTEGLDKQTEQQIMQLLHSHFANKTVLFITHRLINLEQMDAIALIEHGKLLEFGHHHALLAQQGRYHQLTQTL